MEEFAQSWWALGLAVGVVAGVVLLLRRTRGTKASGVKTSLGYEKKEE